MRRRLPTTNVQLQWIPPNFIYLINLADSQRRLGRAHDARTAYRKAIDIALLALEQDPRKGHYRAYVAYISARLGDRKRAENEIAQALQMSRGEIKVIRNAVLTYRDTRRTRPRDPGPQWSQTGTAPGTRSPT